MLFFDFAAKKGCTSQRPIAIHALESPMKFDGGVYLFRKLLRDAINGDNPEASPEAFLKWLINLDGKPNIYRSGNILKIPAGETVEEEVNRHRLVAEQMMEALTERNKFIVEKFAEIEGKNR
jgi:hypothetical protein